MTEAVFPVTISPEAEQHMRNVLRRKGAPGQCFRIGVKGGGCSGFEYLVRLEDAVRETDLVWERDGLKVVCDPKSARFLADAVLNFTGNLLGGGGFQFENPNAARSCGCGTSFTPKQ